MDTTYVIFLFYAVVAAVTYQEVDSSASVARRTVYAIAWPLGVALLVVYFIVCLIVVAWEELTS